MDQTYWDRIADRFDAEVLKIIDRDRTGTLARALTGLAAPGRTVADFGCGNGSLLPLLSNHFGRVIAVDHAARLLADARRRHTDAANIRYVRADLSAEFALHVPVDVALLVNVLLHPDPGLRLRILENAVAALCNGGVLLVVVPAYESLIHTYGTLVETNVDLGMPRGAAVAEIASVSDEEIVSEADGVVRLGTEPTKLYREPELRSLLADVTLTDIRTQRIEYDWDEVIDDAPPDLGAPYPWDWLLVARKL